MVQIVLSGLKADPLSGCAAILQEYYKLDAIESAKVLYMAGWTENINYRGGYGLGELIYIMKTYYGQTSDYALLGILKALGIPPLEAALRIGGRVGWLKDYRAQGYSAADAATWVKADLEKYGLHSQLGGTVRSCDEAGYSLLDIALALRAVYGTDMNTALTYFLNNTTKDTRLINEALTQAYGEDPIQNAIRDMKGSPIKSIVSALRHTYGISDPDTVVDYLREAGFSTAEILQGMTDHYFVVRNAGQLTSYLEYAKEKLPEATFADVLNAVLYTQGYEPSPGAVTSYLIYLGYDMKTAAEFQKTEYRYAITDVLAAMASRFGNTRKPEYTQIVMDVYGMDPVSFIEYERNRGVTASRTAEMLIEIFKFASMEETISVLAKAGYDKESVIDATLDVFFSGQLSSAVIAEIEALIKANFSEGVGDTVKNLLKDGGVHPISNAISTLQSSGFGLDVIVKALKEVYGLSQDQAFSELNAVGIYSFSEISVALQGIYGMEYITMLIKEWQNEPWGDAEEIYRQLKRVSGTTDPGAIFKYMRFAGISEREAIKAMYRDLWEGIVHPLKTVYDIRDAIGMATLLSRVRIPGEFDLYTEHFANQLTAAFPGTTHYQIVKAFEAYGYPIEQSGTDSIIGWLRTYARNGVRDDRLAAYLGKNNGGLNMPVYTAAEILKGKGYSVQDAAYWLLQCGYDWAEFYTELVNNYAPKSYLTFYFDNNSPSKFIVQYLKDYYDVRDIARGDYGYRVSSSGVLADLISGGYTVDQAVYATLWIGGDATGDMVVAIVNNSMARALAANDMGLRINAVDAAVKTFNISLAVTYDKQVAGVMDEDPIGMEDIARSLVEHGPSAYPGQYFSHWEMLEAMERITGRYLQLADIDLPVREASLAALRLAGASPSDAAAMLAAHKVGLSTTSVVKSFFALGNDWFDAVMSMAGSGYSYGDSITAVYNNPSYHMIIGIGVLSSLTTTAINALGESSNVAKFVSVLKKLVNVGLKIAEGKLNLDYILQYDPAYLQYSIPINLKEYVPIP